MSPSNPQNSRLRLRVRPAVESRLRSGHPWVFAESITEQNREGQAGELGVVYDRSNRFLAIGLFDPDSPIRLRALHTGRPQRIDQRWWGHRLEQALELRRGAFDAQTTGFRWINGESDGWPGLVLDRYEETLVLKLYTTAWLPRLDELIELICAELRPERIVLRLSRNLQAAAERFGRVDGQVLIGVPPSGAIIFRESGARFEADVLRGQKTGFFLDQRENRRLAQSLAPERAVLNAFSFSGAFSVYAARGGARAATDLDISPHALTAANRNFALNISDAAVAACHHETVQADAFDWLGTASNRRFGLIILDPPSLARRESERAGALRAYGRLTADAIRHLAPGGYLLACSCSAHVDASEFFGVIRQTAAKSGRRFDEIQTTGHALDHPAAFKEAQYLKAIYLRF